MTKIGIATVAAFGLVGMGVLAGAGTAFTGVLDASPPAIINDNGFQDYDTSMYPAEPTYPAASSWPGRSSHPCCSR